jgi:general secretion pathway protein C
MPFSLLSFWTVRFITFLLWALAAGSAAFWILQNMNANVPSAAIAITQASEALEPNLTPRVASALGAKDLATPAEAGNLSALQTRLQLQGVLAVGTTRGAALISIDGKPAKPYPVGSAIEEGLEVTSVAARSASIGKNGTTAFTLELPNKN